MRALAASLLTIVLLVSAGAVFAQPPGGALGPCVPSFDVREGGPTEDFTAEHNGPISLGCPVFGGYVVLVELPGAALQGDPNNWSDILAFTTGGPVQPGQPTDHMFMLSGSADPTTGLETGMRPADLAVAGLTVADIVANPTTVYIQEGLNPLNPIENDYAATGPAGTVQYRIFSDPPEGPTPTARRTWGRLKLLYR